MRNGHRVACAGWSARALGFGHVYRSESSAVLRLLLGKLIVCAPTRDGAIRKMRSALGELVIEGVSENSELQLDVLANDEFLSGMYHTDLMGHLYADE